MLNLLDKLAFGLALLFALQIPLLADHYQQFLASYYQATKVQVDGYKAVDANNQDTNVQSVVNDSRNNGSASIGSYARQKFDTLQEFAATEQAINLFENSNIVSKAIYMFNPKRADTLKQILNNFVPGLPLSGGGLLFGVIVGLLLNLIFSAPFYLMFGGKKSARRLTFR